MVVLAVCSCVHVLWFLPSRIVIVSLWGKVRWSCWPFAPVCTFCGFFHLGLRPPDYGEEGDGRAGCLLVYVRFVVSSI